MKQKLSFLLLLFLLMCFVSIFSMCSGSKNNSENNPLTFQKNFSFFSFESEAKTTAENSFESPKIRISENLNARSLEDKDSSFRFTGIGYEDFKIFDESTETIITVSNSDFLPGAIAVEMPLSYPEEALKAQAVAAYTYYSRLREQNRTSKTPSPYDFSANVKNWKVYVTSEEMENRWGDNFQEYYTKLTDIANSVKDEALYYDGELALCTYYAISSGKTEACEEVWGGEYDYLIPVDSSGDIYAEGYETTVTVSPEEVKAAAKQKWPEADLSIPVQNWFGETEKTSSGTVQTILLGGEKAKGEDIRIAFGLRSANFEIAYDNGNFIFTVKGYGHGVGMSQTGACYMAKQGSSYQEILQWYYPGTELLKSNLI